MMREEAETVNRKDLSLPNTLCASIDAYRQHRSATAHDAGSGGIGFLLPSFLFEVRSGLGDRRHAEIGRERSANRPPQRRVVRPPAARSDDAGRGRGERPRWADPSGSRRRGRAARPSRARDASATDGSR
jgi:hypothetical protein